MSEKSVVTQSRGSRGVEESLRAFARRYCTRDLVSFSLRVLRASACATLLSGCTTPEAPPAPQCIPLTAWTSAQQDEMRKEYDALPKDAILRAVFMDWIGMRDADRACLSTGGK